VEILASFHTRPFADIPERIDSMELAWLVHQVEQRYGVRLELDDGQLGRMQTVSGAVDVLREVIEPEEHSQHRLATAGRHASSDGAVHDPASEGGPEVRPSGRTSNHSTEPGTRP
jgi:hypothetical protein